VVAFFSAEVVSAALGCFGFSASSGFAACGLTCWVII
jgi:hypothetical protein